MCGCCLDCKILELELNILIYNCTDNYDSFNSLKVEFQQLLCDSGVYSKSLTILFKRTNNKNKFSPSTKRFNILGKKIRTFYKLFDGKSKICKKINDNIMKIKDDKKREYSTNSFEMFIGHCKNNLLLFDLIFKGKQVDEIYFFNNGDKRNLYFNGFYIYI